MLTLWNAARDDLIPEMFNSTSSADLRSLLVARMATDGASTLEQQLFSLLLNDDLLNLLYFTAGDLESTIDEYPITSSCQTTEDFYLWTGRGQLISGAMRFGETFIVQSQLYNEYQTLEIHADGNVHTDYVVTLNNAGAESTWRIYYAWNGSWMLIDDDAPTPAIEQTAAHMSWLGNNHNSTTPFRLSIHVEQTEE
jgi:hypothetical protein